MRRTISALAIASLVVIAACSGKSSSSGGSNASATAAATAMASSANETVPQYPGATLQSATNPAAMARTNASGKIYVTTDSFDKVYAWYKQRLPAGTERRYVTQPAPNAAFVITEANNDQGSVNIAVFKGKTVITVAHIVARMK